MIALLCNKNICIYIIFEVDSDQRNISYIPPHQELYEGCTYGVTAVEVVQHDSIFAWAVKF